MKKNILAKGIPALFALGLLAGCSSDYLDIPPTTTPTDHFVMSNAANVKIAMDGVIEMMNQQYSNLDWNGNCGEAYVGNAMNDAWGPDLISALWQNYSSMNDWTSMNNDRTYANVIPWQYYYGLIAQVNQIINGMVLDETQAGEMDYRTFQFVKAQALTMRAHSYQKLMGLYAPRWEDSNNGAAYCIVYRDQASTGSTPLRTVAFMREKIYKDLDEALQLYEESELTRDAKWNVDANVAHGIYARAALMFHDWDKVVEHAAEARKGYTIMDADTYLGGFTDDCTDYIWHMNPGYDTTYYWSWGSHNACNGGYVYHWPFAAGAMNIDLYRQLDPKDVRCKLYLMPDKIPSGNTHNPGKIKEADFWNPDCVGEDAMFLGYVGEAYTKKNGKKGGMYNVAVFALYNYFTKVFTGDQERFKNDDNFYDCIYIFQKLDNSKTDVLMKKGTYAKLCNAPFGAQTKFWGEVPYGNLAYPWMRASEMALAEAEGYYELGKEKEAKKCLTELMKERVSGYSCTTTGEALRDEIRVARRAELFLEGQNFTDFKRWNIPAERREWVANDVKSGNCAPGKGLKADQSFQHGWMFRIPYSETQYNDSIDMTILP